MYNIIVFIYIEIRRKKIGPIEIVCYIRKFVISRFNIYGLYCLINGNKNAWPRTAMSVTYAHILSWNDIALLKSCNIAAQNLCTYINVQNSVGDKY